MLLGPATARAPEDSRITGRGAEGRPRSSASGCLGALDHAAIPALDVGGADRTHEDPSRSTRPSRPDSHSRASSSVSSGADGGCLVERHHRVARRAAGGRGRRPRRAERSRSSRSTRPSSTTGKACVGTPEVRGRGSAPGSCSAGTAEVAVRIASATVPFASWSRKRDPLVHRSSGREQDEADVTDEDPRCPCRRARRTMHRHARTSRRRRRCPTYPATRIAVRRLCVMPQTAASSIRPPSSGNPGSVFNPAKNRLITRASRRCRGHAAESPWRHQPEDPGHGQRAWPARRTRPGTRRGPRELAPWSRWRRPRRRA